MRRPLLFILDLNGTLLCRIRRRNTRVFAETHPNFKSPEISVMGHQLYFRPHLQFFLDTLFSLGKVAVWTSAHSKNAIPMTMASFRNSLDWDSFTNMPHPVPHHANVHRDRLMLNGNRCLEFLWTQDQCKVLPALPGSFKPQFTKDLNNVWQQFPSFNAENTLIFDDSAQKINLHPENHIHVPEFTVTDHSVNHCQDTVLYDLAVKLSILCNTASSEFSAQSVVTQL